MIRASVRFAVLCSLSLLAAACGGSPAPSSPPPATPAQSFTVRAPQGSHRVNTGSSAVMTVDVERSNGHSAEIQLTLADAPAGVSASGTIAAGATSGTLSVQVTSGFAPSELAVRITGTAGALTASAPLTLAVTGTATGVHARTSYALGRNTVRLDWSQFGQSGEMLTTRLVLDLDADGVEDFFLAPGLFLVQGPGSPVRFYRGARAAGGALSFTEATAHFLAGEVPKFNHARKVLAGDFNADGRKDLFVIAHGYDAAPFPGTTNGLMLSGTDGKLAVSAQPWASVVGFHHGGAAGDIDNDGDLDIFVCESQTGSFLLLNDGHGQFTVDRTRLPASLRRVSPTFTAELLDLDGDDFLDLVVGGDETFGQPTVAFWGNGTGVFSDARAVTVGKVDGWPNVLSYAAEDLDGDGRRELLVSRTKGLYTDADFYKGYRWQLLRVASDRSLTEITSPWATDVNASTATTLVGHDGQPTWAEFYDVIDWDADGHLDLVTSDGWNGNFWSRNSGSSFGPLVRISATPPQPPVTLSPISYAHAKAPGQTPALLPPDANLARAYVNVGDQRLLFSAALRYNTSQTPETATPGDFAFWRRQPDGSWVKDTSLLPGGSAGCIHPRKAIVADFNGDALQDVYVACHGWDTAPFPGERNSIVLSQPNGTYAIQTASQDVGFFHSVAATDFNGDGKVDVVVTNSAANPSVRIYLNQGGGAFALDSAARLPAAVLGQRNFFTVEVLDVNEDGHADLFLGGHEWENAPSVVVLNPGNGDLRNAAVTTLPAVANEGVVLDVVATGTGASRALWLLRTSGGDGTFYQSRVVQRVSWPGLGSTVPQLLRPAQWTPWIIPAVVDGTPVIGSDDAQVDMAIPY